MPAYEHSCLDCRQDFTVFLTVQQLEERRKLRCPHCGSDHVQRKFGPFYAKTARKS